MVDILLLTQGTWGDILPFVQIGKELKSRGYRVALISNSVFDDKVRQAGFDLRQVINLPTFQEWNRERKLPDTKISRLLHLKDQIGWFYRVVESHSRRPNAVLVSHFGLHLAVQMAVDRLKLPYLPVYSAPFFMLNVAVHEELYRTHSAELNRARAEYGLPPVADWHAWIRAQPQSLALWPEWFAPREAGWPSGVRLSGFVSNQPPAPDGLPDEAQKFLASGPPPIFINHGSSRPLKEDYFRVGIEACRLLGRRAIVVTKYHEFVADCLGRDVLYCPYIHFPSLLPHISVMVHHGGIGTTGQTLAAGAPQLLFPDNSDQHDNASRLQRLGVAECLAPFRRKPEIIAESLHRLSTSPVVRQQCRRLADLSRQGDPIAAACEAVEDFIADHLPSRLPVNLAARETAVVMAD